MKKLTLIIAGVFFMSASLSYAKSTEPFNPMKAIEQSANSEAVQYAQSLGTDTPLLFVMIEKLHKIEILLAKEFHSTQKIQEQQRIQIKLQEQQLIESKKTNLILMAHHPHVEQGRADV